MLEDRSYVYYPNPVARNKPVTIGHEYSTLALLLPKEEKQASSWVVPLSVLRIASSKDNKLVWAEQINRRLDNEQAP